MHKIFCILSLVSLFFFPPLPQEEDEKEDDQAPQSSASSGAWGEALAPSICLPSLLHTKGKLVWLGERVREADSCRLLGGISGLWEAVPEIGRDKDDDHD